ncbi:DUF2306 domain-containing protein [Chitinophaga silvatica]|uniref:DUF2306 domain-containing protein n=1 Tax=Chitinophaga silvatica TaxID=2282649 RepID=A0A3E1YBC8_9BACT|nr:DUF2306 domain-containing protein [Chitinophaga silvatica]RFS23325.1 DUF2306 domain-containing protein [Chitinophaga silvatica]
MIKYLRNTGWVVTGIIICFGAWLMLRLTIPYAAFDRYTDFLNTKQRVYHLLHWRASFYVHIFVSIFVLLAGMLQFSRWLLKKHPQIHRASGKLYAVIIIAFSGPSGLIMGIYANGGISGRISFVLLSVLWLGFTIMGWIRARQGKWKAHIIWMLRSYALTLSALTLRFFTFLIGIMHLHIPPFKAYVLVAWTSWTINLLIAEIVVKRLLLKRMKSFIG